MYFCDGKADFSAAVTPVLTAHYPSEIPLICWFAVLETLIIIFIILKHAFFQGLWWIESLTVFIWNVNFFLHYKKTSLSLFINLIIPSLINY